MADIVDTTQVNASSMEALGARYEAIAHNLANVSTAGYKAIIFAFASSQAPAPGTAVAPVREQPGTVVGSPVVDFSQGNLVRTERPLDLALNGKGFFVLETPQGPLYTRNGSFQTNAQGQLVDGAGRTVAGEGGPLMIPQGAAGQSLQVGSDGRLMAGRTEIGKLRLVEFTDPQVLTPAGQSAFQAPAGTAPAAATKTTVHQGYQEASNVSAVEELVGLITVSRLYEANAKAVQMQSEAGKTLMGVALG
jgi:flagellar basal body rod protein FlgG